MPVSRKYNCLFLHLPKTAGTQLTTVFGKDGVQLSLGKVHINTHTVCVQHQTGAQMRSYVGAAAFDAYFRFAVVRNPFDRMYSEFCWQRQLKKTTITNFDDFVDRVYVHFATIQRFNRHEPDAPPNDAFNVPGLANAYYYDHLRPQYEYLYANGPKCKRQWVHKILRFESIADEFDAMSREKGWGLKWPRTSFNNASQTREPDYRAAYTRELTRQRVAEMYADDLKLFGYAF